MSKVTTPEPVAVVVSGFSIYGFSIYWAGTGPVAPMLERNGVKAGSLLITTEQAEAYAAARVREALEDAAKVAMNAPITADMLESDDAKAVSFHASSRIRRLIPSTN